MTRNMQHFRNITSRRGNTLILVTAILVLLVIIASAYISRVQGGRVGGAARQGQQKREEKAQSIANDLAREISEALFARPVNTAIDPMGLDASAPRLPIPPDAVRYGYNLNDLANFIRHNPGEWATIPYTNWPDPASGASINFPGGSAGDAALANLGLGETNAFGGPGFGDSRWLASFEPIRWQLNGFDNIAGTRDDIEIFSHYRHMSNISRPNNGFRICRDISDVLGSFPASAIGGGGVVTDLSLPVEQFLAMRPTGSGANSAISAAPNFLPRIPNDFAGRWSGWFNNYANVYLDPTITPPNFLRLSDLDGDGIKFNFGDTPASEFNRGTARWNVGRVLCDTDGDGFTDSFWHLAPESIDRGTRTIVGVRIIDNSAMANLNVATRYQNNDTSFFPDARTKGTTPADIALVGEMRRLVPNDFLAPYTNLINNWNIGLLDNPLNWSRPPYTTNFFSGLSAAQSAEYWNRHIFGLGMSTANNYRPNQVERLNWWRRVGAAGPLTPDAVGFAPYGLDTELELRMYAGNNNPWSYNRLEFTTQATTATAGAPNAFGAYIFRGPIDREESSEYQDQLDNLALVGDMRHRVTTYNATRTDMLPPWLWLDGWITDIRRRQKIDLRAPNGNFYRDNVVNEDDRNFLYEMIYRALVEKASNEAYYGGAGTVDEILGKTNRMAAGLAANIMAYQDELNYAPLDEAIIVTADNDLPAGVTAGELRAMGFERQPFLVEAMIGHVYDSEVALNAHASPAIAPGDHIVCGSGSNQSTFVVVQIANPFDEDLLLNDPRAHFELEVMGQTFDLAQLAGGTSTVPPVVPTSSYASPKTLTIIAMEDMIGTKPLKDPLIELLGLDDASVVLVDLENFGDPWDMKRANYDLGATGPLMVPAMTKDAIQIVRVTADPISGTDKRVVIDRFNDPATQNFGTGDSQTPFLSIVGRMDADEPGGDCSVEPPPGAPWPGVLNIGPTDTHWFQWAHVTRAWGTSANADEVSPRYVFANRMASRNAIGGDSFIIDDTVIPATITGVDTSSITAWPIAFNNGNYAATGYPDKNFDGNQNGEDMSFSFQMLQKDDDFEQVGELLNVFTHGHLLQVRPGSGYERTLETFSEYLQEELAEPSPDPKVRVGRLDPFRTGSVITGDPLVAGATVTGRPPAMPAAMRVLDAFVCDGRGKNNPPPAPGTDPYQYDLRMANGFTGKPVHGLININSAPVEVLRALPNMARLIHGGNPPPPTQVAYRDMPRSAFAEAIVQAREKYNGALNPAAPMVGNGRVNGPDYTARGTNIPNLRTGVGFQSIGELLALEEDGANTIPEYTGWDVDPKAWSVTAAAQQPFTDTNGTILNSAFLATDVVQPASVDELEGDEIGGDAEEYNMLFSGMSNLITTRSDTFTVYFRVRSFRQNPTTGVWDATDPENIVDDSRYVMLVDRSDVNSPSDQPRILYLEKLPN